MLSHSEPPVAADDDERKIVLEIMFHFERERATFYCSHPFQCEINDGAALHLAPVPRLIAFGGNVQTDVFDKHAFAIARSTKESRCFASDEKVFYELVFNDLPCHIRQGHFLISALRSSS